MSESAAAPAASTAPVSDSAPTEATDADLDAADVADEAAETAKSAKAAPKASAATKSGKRTYSPKVNGRQVNVEFDPTDDAQMLNYLQKAMASDEKFQEAAALRKNVEALVHELKTNTRGVLSHPELGIDIKKFAEEILNEEIKNLQKTPEQRQMEELQKQLEGEKKQREQLEEARRTSEMARLEEQAFKQFDDEITGALEKYPNLPKSPYVVKRIADTMIEAVNKGFKDVSVNDIMPIVEGQISGEIQKMFETMPEEVMEKLIGKQNLGRLRKKRLNSMKKPVETAQGIKPTGKTGDSKTTADKPIRFNDLFGKF